MKPSSLLLTASFAIITACSSFQKEGQTDESLDDRTVVLPSEELAKKSGYPLKDLHIGFGVWVRECGKCHDHVFPDDVSREDWHIITPKMAWNANITETEQQDLIKYILAAKTEPNKLGKQLQSMKVFPR